MATALSFVSLGMVQAFLLAHTKAVISSVSCFIVWILFFLKISNGMGLKGTVLLSAKKRRYVNVWHVMKLKAGYNMVINL